MKSGFRFLLLLIVVPILSERVCGDDWDQQPLPDSQTVVRKLIERATLNLTNQHAASFAFYRTNITEEYNSRGKVTERKESVKKVVLKSGERTTTLVLYNGKPPTEKDVAREEKKKVRRRSGEDDKDPPDRSKQLNSYFTQDILGRFVFTVLGREAVGGRSCLLVRFQPGPARGTSSKKIFDRVINNMGGIIWVDEKDFELVKADIQLRKRVKMWGGLLAALEQISLKIQRIHTPEGFWMDHKVEARFTGRALTKRIDVMTWDFTSKPISVEETPAEEDSVVATQ